MKSPPGRAETIPDAPVGLVAVLVGSAAELEGMGVLDVDDHVTQGRQGHGQKFEMPHSYGDTDNRQAQTHAENEMAER